MANAFRITLRGPALKLGTQLRDPDIIDFALRPGFDQAAVLVLGQAKADVHRVTSKLGGSLGSELTGHGMDLEAHIGPQPGMGQPAHYDESMTSRWKTPRSGTNTGDPQVYGVFEEARPGHEFLEPALMDNLDRIDNAVGDSWERAMRLLGRT